MNALDVSLMLQILLEGSRMIENVPEYSSIFQYVPGNSGQLKELTDLKRRVLRFRDVRESTTDLKYWISSTRFLMYLLYFEVLDLEVLY